MKILVIRSFIDKETKKPYNAGYEFESTDEERIIELQEKGFLKKVEIEKFPKSTGGGWYELSDGRKIQGEKQAIAAEKSIGDSDVD